VKLILLIGLILFFEGTRAYLFALSECKEEGISLGEWLDKQKELRNKRIARFKKWFLPSKSEKIRP